MTIEEKAKEHQEQNVSHMTGRGGATDIKRAFIAGVKEATRWIPVEENLPEDYDELMTKEGPDELGLYSISSPYLLAKDTDGNMYITIRYVIKYKSEQRPFTWECGGVIVAWRQIEFN